MLELLMLLVALGTLAFLAGRLSYRWARRRAPDPAPGPLPAGPGMSPPLAPEPARTERFRVLTPLHRPPIRVVREATPSHSRCWICGRAEDGHAHD